MHTSSSTHANAGLANGQSGATAFPPPMWGRDREGGTTSNGPCVRSETQSPHSRFSNLHRICFAPCALSPPLSLSLPHMGGGNRVARTFATHDQRNSRCAHAPLGSGDQLLAEFSPLDSRFRGKGRLVQWRCKRKFIPL